MVESPQSFVGGFVHDGSRLLPGMQNLSISCSLVCLIILGTAVLIGFFGLCRHQISAVLVTGVMYLLAGESNGDRSGR